MRKIVEEFTGEFISENKYVHAISDLNEFLIENSDKVLKIIPIVVTEKMDGEDFNVINYVVIYEVDK